MSETDAILLTVADLHRQFGGVHAVNGASFAVPSGRITGLIGPNGAGKSTVLDVIAGALKPTAGKISYRGQDITGCPHTRWPGAGSPVPSRSPASSLR